MFERKLFSLFALWQITPNTASFFANGDRKLPFQWFDVGWLNPKLAAIFAWPKQPCDVTGCITLKPYWKFRVIMGEETSVLNWHPKTALGHLRADKQLLTVFLHTEEDDSRFLDLSHQIKCIFFWSASSKRHCSTHLREQSGMVSYRQRQISRSYCEISRNKVKKLSLPWL